MLKKQNKRLKVQGGNGLEYMSTDSINKICDKFNGIITAAYAHLDEGDDYPGYFSTESTKAKQITFDLNGGTLD